MRIEIKTPPNLSFSEDRLTKREEKNWDHEDKKEDVLGKITDRRLKICFALATFILVTCWIYKVLNIICLEGYQTNSFHLSDPVLVTLLSTTSVNIFAYLFVVLKYLFNNSHKENKKK